MRYSRQRELVLRQVEKHCDHPTAEEIYYETAKECPGLSLGTVYRDLNRLVDMGCVRRVTIPGKADRFDRTLEPHSHLYCTQCGRVVDVEFDEQKVLPYVSSPHGVIQGCSVTFYGVCSACLAAQAQQGC